MHTGNTKVRGTFFYISKYDRYEVGLENIMKEIGPIAGIDCENTAKMTIEERIIMLFRTMGIPENIKVVIQTSIGMRISMIVIDLMILIILMVEIGHMTETGHIVETGTTPENTKETGHTLEIDYMTEMILIVEIDHETTVEMSIKWKIINIREGLEIIMKTGVKMGM